MKYLGLILLAACSQQSMTASTAPWITKQGLIHAERMESAPVVWTDGSVVDVIFDRFSDPNGPIVEFYQGQTKLNQIQFDGVLGSAMMVGTRLYIISTASNYKSVSIHYTDDLTTLVGPISTIQAPAGTQFYNSSMSADPNGFVLTIEISESGSGTFKPSFYRSTDGLSWNVVAAALWPRYAACPTVRYFDGYYYVFYLRHIKDTYVTVLTRSRDLVNFEDAHNAVLVPDQSEGQNNSDMDLIERNGQVIINYAAGNQDNDRPLWTQINRAAFEGTMEQFVERFY